MDTPLVTWICIVAAVLLVFAINAARALVMMSRKHALHHVLHTHNFHNILGVARESDILYLPGDPMPGKPDDYDADDFECS